MPVTSTSWRPGQSGNPHGRPRRGSSLSEALRAELEKDGALDKVIAALVKAALAGDLRAIHQVFDRLEGRPMQRQEVSGPEGGALLVGKMSDEERRSYLRRILEDQPPVERITAQTEGQNKDPTESSAGQGIGDNP